jgi:N-ethylmaleimide reductase
MKTKNLFSPTRLGPYTLKNRVVLPPLTRSRSSQPGDIPNELMAEYYAQRSSAGFMVTEGTQIEPRGQGYAWTPGIYSSRQVEGWKKVTRAVHEKEGIIFAQLWHVGRVSHNSLQPGNASPVAPSAIPAGENVKVFIETGPGEGALATASCPAHWKKRKLVRLSGCTPGQLRTPLMPVLTVWKFTVQMDTWLTSSCHPIATKERMNMVAHYITGCGFCAK